MVSVLSSEVENTPLQQFLVNSLYFFESIYSGIVWIDKLKIFASIFDKKAGKRQFPTFHVCMINYENFFLSSH